MKNLVIASVCLCFSSAFAQKITDTLVSKKLNQEREITIGLPASYAQNPTKKYPLVVVLDGDYLFDAFQGVLNYGAYWDDFPETILVGITQNKNDERSYDCSADEMSGLPDSESKKFFEFIGLELMPALEKEFRIAPLKIIAGHDITAGFINFYLYKNQPLFDGYISLSPQLANGMTEQLPQRLTEIQKQLFYYQASADGDLKSIQQSTKLLDENIVALHSATLNYKYDEFKGLSHYSLVPQAIPSALYQFFALYQPISMNEFNDKIAVLPSGYVDYLTQKYELLEKTLHIEIPIRVNDFKAIEAAILKNKQYEEFGKLAEISDKYYPKSMLSDFHLGMMYENMGDYKKAAKAYQKAYQKEEIGSLTKDMMLDKSDELMKK
jgi:predicted alpha/beta superfamily hydrolase